MSARTEPEDAPFKILLVEDDNFKQELVEQALREAGFKITLAVGRSVQQAVQLVRSDVYDLIILDIALPSHENRPGGAQPISQPSGGLEVLLELSYEERADKVVIVTQYPEIEYDGTMYLLNSFQSHVAKTISANIVGVILFNAQDHHWRSQLRAILTCEK